MTHSACTSKSSDLKQKLRGRLLAATGLTIKRFSEQYGYKTQTVDKVLKRYADGEKTPRGPLSSEILNKIAEVIEASNEPEPQAEAC